MSDILEDWFSEETKIDNVTLTQFDKYIEEYLAQRDIVDGIEDQLKEANGKLKKMDQKLIEFLDHLNKDGHKTPSGALSVVNKDTWKPPEGEGRQALLEMLKEKDIYDSVMAFNSAKFHSWYKSEKESNPEFDVPGVELNSIRYIRYTRKK